jgi:cytoplasmic iron level regulating protein YaaA (DUF328/UPF0246 family)
LTSVATGLAPANRIAILLPPSEGKAEGGDLREVWDPHEGSYGPRLGEMRLLVAREMRRLRGGDAPLLGVQGENLLRARRANAALVGAPTLPAWRRYTGVVWNHLDVGSLSPASRARALGSIVVFSGLLGAVRAADPVPDYRLKMGARLEPTGQLAAWWREPLSALLNELLAGCTVVDLLPQEHRAAFVPDRGSLAAYLCVNLVDKSGRSGGHGAKAAKGRLVRHLVETCPMSSRVPQTVMAFRDGPYRAVIE